MNARLTNPGRPRFSRRLAIVVAAGFAFAAAALPVQADGPPECRVRGDAIINTGDRASGNAHSTEFLAGLGTGRWRHITPAGDRFDGRLTILACHSNTGEIADFEGTGSFHGSDVVLTLMGHIEDLARFGVPDYYSMAIFSGPTLVYNAMGSVVAGDFTVTITP